MKEEAQSFFDSKKETNLTIKKKVKNVVFMSGPYGGHELSYVALYDTEYHKKNAKNVRPRQENKRLDKTSTGKDLTFFNFLHQQYTNKPHNKNN